MTANQWPHVTLTSFLLICRKTAFLTEPLLCGCRNGVLSRSINSPNYELLLCQGEVVLLNSGHRHNKGGPESGDAVGLRQTSSHEK